MAKLVSKHFGMVVSIEPTKSVQDIDKWSWRKKYEGFVGLMNVYESQREYPGKNFIVIYDIELNYLKTGVGELIHNGDILTLTTQNSIYTFKSMDVERKEGE